MQIELHMRRRQVEPADFNMRGLGTVQIPQQL
jgi:hypothetical protein